jgi:hypothetical protein
MLDIKNLPVNLGCRFYAQPTSSWKWFRCFVVDDRGESLGRINFKNNVVINFRWYCEFNFIIAKVLHFHATGKVLTIEQYDDAWTEALRLCIERDDAAQAWRDANPTTRKRNRRKLAGWDPKIQQRLLISRMT